jgi:hypothetical protein
MRYTDTLRIYYWNNDHTCKIISLQNFVLLVLILTKSCAKNDLPDTIDLKKNCCFSPDDQRIGKSQKWYCPNFDDSKWIVIDAGKSWEKLDFRDLDGFAWYRKTVEIPSGLDR